MEVSQLVWNLSINPLQVQSTLNKFVCGISMAIRVILVSMPGDPSLEILDNATWSYQYLGGWYACSTACVW
jgi:hypothetical protein